jgi:hypothetical protein
MNNNQPSPSNRIIAALLAVIWLALGFAAIFLGIIYKHWLMLLPGLFTVWYGLIWTRAAIESHHLEWPSGLFPWRR